MYSLPKNVYRERKDFSKIKTTVPIPNLIEIQRKSYERFLQMNRLPSEREDAGLQSVFKSVFPISDFRENSSLEFIEYSIGNWECKCGKLSGLHHLRKPCKNCGATLIADPYGDHVVLCPRCGIENQARGDVCDICGHTVGMKLKYDVDECQERGMTYAVPLKVTIRLVVWNRADHPVSRLVGGVRVRPEEPALRPHRPQAQVPRHGVPAGPRAARRRRNHPHLLLGRPHLLESGPVPDVGRQ
jgi:DNA-directed RNA polymerase subunit beta